MRGLRVMVVIALVAVPASSRAATFVYLSSAGPEEPTLTGRRLRLTPTEVGRFPQDGGGVAMTLRESSGASYRLYLVPPAGQRFQPGSYPGAADCGWSDRPGVCLERDASGGAPVGGHIEVREAAYDGAGNLIVLAADFSQHRAASGSAVTGSVRLNAGDGACGGAPDGTSCDDADACSVASTCRHGECVAEAGAACDAGEPSSCRDPAVCDPVGGACLPPSAWADGVGCRSEDRCVVYGACMAGVCIPDQLENCYDAIACTYDTCDTRAGCTFPPIPGACGLPGVPSASFFARRTPGEFAGDMTLSTPSAGLEVHLGDDGSVFVSAPGERWGAWSASFSPPRDARLAVGTYDDVAASSAQRGPGQAALEVRDARALDCGRAAPGRFVVRQFASGFLEGGRGDSLAISADFERRCEDGSVLSGSLRFRAGDPRCVGAVDGTPCDDHDACTATSSCEGGACRGHDPVVCEAIPGACHVSPACDPATGACVEPPPLPDDAACSDPAACVPEGRCHGGVCTQSGPVCDDANPCTADRCAGGGACVHDPLPGCWLVVRKVKLTAQASGTLQGQSVECGPLRCQRAGQGVLLLPGDGTYRVPSGEVECSNGETSRLPDEVGTVKVTRGGKLRLRLTNRTELRDAIRACSGRRVTLSGRQWIQISDDGRELAGVARTRFTIFDRLPLVQTTVARLEGRLGEFPPPATIDPGRACPERISLRCVAR